MNRINRYKYDLIGISLLLLLFILSVHVRKENLDAPLSRHHEWITAHSLITAEIWDQNGGPSAYGFNPVYTYKGEGNAYRRGLGGITAPNGDVYYVSYPPFAFIFLYYSTQVLGGPTVANVRIVSLGIHLISAFLVYFLIGSIRPRESQRQFNYAGLIGAGLYLFAQGNLWFHGNLYFSDMVVQPLFIAGLLITIRYFKGNYKSEFRILVFIAAIFFLASYTEWLGLLAAFFCGISFLIAVFIKRQKKFLKPFLVIAVASSLGLGTTLLQFSSIDGWSAFKEVSEKKYAERSGHGTTQDSAAQFNIHEAQAFDLLKTKLNSNYKNTENLIGFSFIILSILLIVKLIRKTFKTNPIRLKWSGFLILLGLLPILVHYLLFFNFNSMHDFSGLKTGFYFILLFAIIVYIIEQITAEIHPGLYYGILTVFFVLTTIKSFDAVERYKEEHSIASIDNDRVQSALKIAEHSSPDVAVLTNVRLSPEQMFYAKHSISPVTPNDTITILNILKLYRNTAGHYYHHEGSVLKYMQPIERNENELTFGKKILFE